MIAAVSDEELRNKFRAQRSTEPVISFLDGKRLVLNSSMLRKCIEWFGPDSENWVGRRVRVFVTRVEKTNKETGRVTFKVQRGIVCEDAHARFSIQRRSVESVSAFGQREPGDDDAVVTESDAHEPEAEAFLSGRRRAR